MNEKMKALMNDKEKMIPMIESVMDDVIETGECFLLKLIIDDPKLRSKMAEMMMIACPTMISEIIPEEKIIDFKEMIDKEFLDRMRKKNG